MNDLERLVNYYAAGRLFLPRPRYLCFNATLRCDGHCGHCGIWKEKPTGVELGASDLGRVLAGALFQKVETAWITGGEPTLRDDLGELAAAMASSLSALCTLGLATNGLDPDRVIARVKAMRGALDPARHGLFAHLSLDGTGAIHDQVRGRPGAFAAVAETLSRLVKLRDDNPAARIEIGLNCVIQPGNVAGLDDLFAFARGRGLPLMFNVVLVTDQIYRNQSMGAALAFSDDDRRRVIAFLDRIAPESPAPFRYQYGIIKEVLRGGTRPRRCLTLFTTININADGSLFPCPAASDLFPKNVLKEDVEKLWSGGEARDMRRRIAREFCPTCMLSCSLGDSMPAGEWVRGGWE
ncbi:MAG TPA: radical SAM protein [bacterium]|nr:radical SAM protein [bacterium]